MAPPPTPAARGRRRDELVAQFTRADRDGDTRLRRNEWTADSGSFEEADTNRDGVVTRDEFITARLAAARNTGDRAGAPVADLRRGTPAFQAGLDRGLADGRQAGKEIGRSTAGSGISKASASSSRPTPACLKPWQARGLPGGLSCRVPARLRRRVRATVTPRRR